MARFLKLERNGADAYVNLFVAMGDPQIFAKDTVQFEVLQQVCTSSQNRPVTCQNTSHIFGAT